MCMQLNSFLGCIKLETGAKIVGILHFFICLIALLGCGISFGVSFKSRYGRSYGSYDSWNSYGNSRDIQKIYAEQKFRELNDKNDVLYYNNDVLYSCVFFLGTLMASYAIHAVYNLLQGVVVRNSSKIKPAATMSNSISIILLFLSFSSFPQAAIGSIVYLYFSLVLNSLQNTFKEEEKAKVANSSSNVIQRNQQPAVVVQPNPAEPPQNVPFYSIPLTHTPYVTLPSAPPSYKDLNQMI